MCSSQSWFSWRSSSCRSTWKTSMNKWLKEKEEQNNYKKKENDFYIVLFLCFSFLTYSPCCSLRSALDPCPGAEARLFSLSLLGSTMCWHTVESILISVVFAAPLAQNISSLMFNSRRRVCFVAPLVNWLLQMFLCWLQTLTPLIMRSSAPVLVQPSCSSSAVVRRLCFGFYPADVQLYLLVLF